MSIDIDISAPHIELSLALKDHITSEMNTLSEKYFPSEQLTAEVSFSIDKHRVHNQYHCKIIYHIRKNHSLRIIAENKPTHDIYEAFNQAAAKLKIRISKYKDKLTKSVHNAPKIAAMTATEYTVDTNQAPTTNNSNNPVIINAQPSEIFDLTVGEAVMKVELENLPALMFRNSDTTRMNLLYYRTDGNLVWVDTTA